MPRNLENAQVQGKFSYTIGKELGSGSFGAVHRVARRDGQERAMKISFESSNPIEIFKFAQEAYKTQALKHENIIPIEDLHYFELEGKPYYFFTMPLANRGSLRSFAPRGTTVDPETGVPLLSQAAEGIHYGHTQRVIHRDVKPENILLDEREKSSQPGTTYLHVLVSDFGISVWGHGDESLVKHGTGGTLPYMAPEQFEGEPRPESDQYGLAVVAHELFTGQRPYAIKKEEALNEIQQLTRFRQLHQDAPVPPFGNNVLQKNPALLSEIEKIVKKGMSKNPGERYPSTQAFGQALRKVLTDYLLSEEAEKQRKVFEAAKPQQVEPQPGQTPEIPPTLPDVQELLRQGDILLQQGNYKEALQMFDRAVQHDPKNVEALFNKGSALKKIGRLKEAIATYDQAIELNPQYSEAYFNKGIALYQLTRNWEAIAACDQAIKINPQDSNAYYNKGILLERLGRKREALKFYKKAVKINPSNKYAQEDVDRLKKS